MLAPWLINALRREQEEQARQDRESWERQPRVSEAEYPVPPMSQVEPDRIEGGICEVNFYL